MSMIPPDEFGKEVEQFDPTTLVQMCADACRTLDAAHQAMRQVTLNGQQAIVTQHTFAELTMWAIRNHEASGIKKPLPQDVVRLANNIFSIQDPFLGTNAGGIMTLVRMAYEQFPYQEQLKYLIPRHIILYLESNPSQLSFDMDGEFSKVTGLAVKDFMIIGLVFYSAAIAYHSFDRLFIENTQVSWVKPYVTPDKINKFLAAVGTDFQDFKKRRLEEETAAPGLGRYTFNPLLSRPVVKLPNGPLCVPIPRLLIYRITQGIYYDLLDAHRRPKGNTFSDWFGYAFQEYIGILLRDTFGSDKVYSEVADVDWLVILGDSALVLECRSGRLPKKIRSHTDRTEVTDMISRNIVDPAEKLPGKIERISKGISGIPTDKVKTYLPAIITCQEWYPVALTRDLAEKELKQRNVSGFHFDLLSADDIEWLLAWASYENPISVLNEMRVDKAGKDLSIGQYVGIRAKRKGITKIDKALLSKKRAEYFKEILPESEDKTYTHLG